MVKLFVLKDDEVTFNRDEVLLHKEFDALWRVVKKSKDDAYGRKKLYNRKAIRFIYFMCDYQSPYFEAGFTYNVLIQKCAKEAGFQSKDKFSITDTLQTAIEKYTELQNVSSLRLLKSSLKGLALSNDTIEYLTEVMQKTLDELRQIDPNTENAVDKDLIATKMGTLMGNIGKIQSISADIPKLVDSLENVRKKVRLEASEKREKAGGGAISDRELPGYRKRLKENEGIVDIGLEKLDQKIVIKMD